ncbi:serine/threonine protein kinase [Phocaeicola salanitronis DSM 18170]|uniref:Serine/threonine protein kinase n=1 Tax=Phocaeicola salanitronis (strain DSM 18170 / JCM 13657 / CCUG 60908 / BL78) TaxID=667015 RepID=F0R7Y5_PHOSB|nr:serine/threonine-protein kinase [Phocaeicola salanitronis]ADY35927.1 serine/threonine protein kinase [Phocaeicola salanitronis DSM 18170]
MSVMIIQGAAERLAKIHYEIDTEEKPLGVGGMGQVFKGIRVDEKTGVRIPVAIKFLFDDLPVNVIERARREASIQIHNENLVEMYGFIQIDEEIAPGKVHERYHVVSELLHGVMLYDLLKGKVTDNEGSLIPFAEELYRMYQNERREFAVFIIKNVLSGIMALHDKGYVHRDIDPSNIMITSDRKVKIIDFGIAKQMSTLNTQDQLLTTAGMFMGKAAYAAPELVLGDVSHQNETTDIYAIGIMFFQLVTGNLPFEGATHEILEMQQHKKMPLQLIEDKALRKIIGKATEKEQSKRYQSAAEFRVAVEQLKSLEKESTSHIKIEEFVKGHQKQMVIVAAVMAVIIVGCIGVMISGDDGKSEEDLLAIQQRRAELQDVVIDDTKAYYEIDSLSGCTIKTSALITQEALSYLQSPTEALKGLDLLDKVISKKYISSAEAAYLKGRLYAESHDSLSLYLKMRENLKGKISVDNQKSHKLNLLSVQLDSTSYKALYELGCDYYAGETRIGVADSRDISLALSYFEKGLKYAESAGDEEFVNKCAKRIEELSGL